MALQGSIESFAIADVLGLLEASNKTGRLVVSGERSTASLWVHDGLLVGGAPSAGGPTALVIDAALIEVLRFDSGSFVFESEVRCDDPAPGVSIGDAVERATASLVELASLGERIPSSDARVSLAATLAAEPVVLDRHAWAAIAAIGDGASVAELGRRLLLDEIALFRCVSGLLDLGVVELGPAVFDQVPTVPAANEDQWPSQAESFHHSPPDPGGVEVSWPTAVAAATPVSDVFAPPAQVSLAAPIGSVSDVVSAESPRVESAVPDGLDVLFGDFDPFSAPAAPPYRSMDSLDWSDPLTSQRSDAPLTPSAPIAVDDEDLARQLAVLSPRAAQAVAVAVQESTASAGIDSSDLEPEGRDHVLRFLDSVQ